MGDGCREHEQRAGHAAVFSHQGRGDFRGKLLPLATLGSSAQALRLSKGLSGERESRDPGRRRG